MEQPDLHAILDLMFMTQGQQSFPCTPLPVTISPITAEAKPATHFFSALIDLMEQNSKVHVCGQSDW
jgi:hypothetical protein